MPRFIVRQFDYGFRIIEIVSDSPQYGTLTIQWDGLFRTENFACDHIETTLGIKLRHDGLNTFCEYIAPKRKIGSR